MKSVFPASILAALLFALPAFAQQAKPQTEELTVLGHRMTQQELETVISGFIDDHVTLSAVIHQVTRWHEPICPRVQNVAPGIADFILKRIVAVAADVGETIRSGCFPGMKSPNIDIVFASQPQLFMDGVVEKKPWLLGHHPIAKAKEVATVKRPIQAWYMTETSNGSGCHLADDATLGTQSCGLEFNMQGGNSMGGAARGPPLPIVKTQNLSHMTQGLESIFVHVLILVNPDTLPKNVELGPVADYIAMLALSQPSDPDKCGALPSIFDLTSDCAGAKPSGLTVPDKSYLKGLYGVDMQAFEMQQKGTIAWQMKKALVPGADLQ